tara:strand:+ start:11346 stop:13832 length:2487 start_codon:yes stop_codon:yes gene_type:complete
MVIPSVAIQFLFAQTYSYSGPEIGSSDPGVEMCVDELPDISEPLDVSDQIAPNIEQFWGEDSLDEIFEEPLIHTKPVLDSSVSGEYGSRSEELYVDFEGIFNTGTQPPDPVIAVGDNYIVLVVNHSIAILNKDGEFVKQTTLGTWFENVDPAGDDYIFDPKVIYDHYSNRWVVLGLTKTNDESAYMVSFSQTSDPTGCWYNYNLNAKVNGELFTDTDPDYPGLGFDQDLIVITSDQWLSGTYDFARVRIIDKSEPYSGNIIRWVDFWDFKYWISQTSRTIKPAHHFGDNNGIFYLFHTKGISGGAEVVYWFIKEPFNPIPTVDRKIISVDPYSHPGNVPQKDVGDEELLIHFGCLTQDITYRNGKIYSVFSTKYDWGSGDVGAIRYLIIDTNVGVLVDDITYGSDGLYYFYPNIYTDSDENVLLVFNRSGETEYAGVRWTFRLASDGWTRPSFELKSGEGPYYRPNDWQNRWGDYTGIAIDPTDSKLIWFYGEWATTVHDEWGTWVGAFKFLPVDVPVVFSNMYGNVNAGGSLLVNENVEIESGDTFYMMNETSNKVKTMNERFENWNNNEFTIKHNNWNYNRLDYILTHHFELEQNTPQNQVAYFEKIDEVVFSLLPSDIIETTLPVEIKDPWWMDPISGDQPGTFQVIQNDGSHEVFLNQGGYDPNNLQFPYYSIWSPLSIEYENDLWVFNQWESNPGASSLFSDNELFWADILFDRFNFQITANYITYPEIGMSNEYNTGWNLVGLPLQVVNSLVISVFPNAIPGSLFSWSGGTENTYQNENGLNWGKGYWIQFPYEVSNTINGMHYTRSVNELQEGWNLILTLG